MRKRTQQADVLDLTAQGFHVKGYGKNFKPLIAAGSWQISGFHYGRSKCACCGRPIWHVLHLKNGSHADAAARDAGYPFPETIEIGIVCGPKVFTESCIGFYDDPAREWERQMQSWKDFISYTILCVRNDDLWQRVPEQLRAAIDGFLQEGFRTQEHSGGWWMVKDAKKRFLRARRLPERMPDPRVMYTASRGLLYTTKRNGLLHLLAELRCDINDGTMTLVVPEHEVA